jgi:hypothetical protein
MSPIRSRRVWVSISAPTSRSVAISQHPYRRQDKIGARFRRLRALFVAQCTQSHGEALALGAVSPVGSSVSVRRREDGGRVGWMDVAHRVARKYSACTLRDGKIVVFSNWGGVWTIMGKLII